MQQTFQPNRFQAFGLLLGSLAFTAVGYLLWNDERATFGTRAGTVFFALCTLTALVLLLPGSGYLRLTEQGMEVKHLTRTRFYHWSDIESFGVVTVTIRRSMFKVLRNELIRVGFNFSPTYNGPQSFKIAGYQALLPDNYGHDVARLADLLNEWKTRYALG